MADGEADNFIMCDSAVKMGCVLSLSEDDTRGSTHPAFQHSDIDVHTCTRGGGGGHQLRNSTMK